MTSPLERFERDEVKAAIDKLLDQPDFKTATIEWVKITEAWTCLKFVGGPRIVCEVGIWNESGDAYFLVGGAVEDDPFLTLAPDSSSGVSRDLPRWCAVCQEWTDHHSDRHPGA
jgi:hypothetical protein